MLYALAQPLLTLLEPPPPRAQVSNAYQLQDLRCSKCGTVATSHLQRCCDLCGAHLCEKAQCKGARQAISALHNVAAYHGMEALAELARL